MFRGAKAVALDFDGVIANSSQECLFLSYQTYTESPLSQLDLSSIPASFAKDFQKYRYLVGPPEEYLSLCESISAGTIPESFRSTQLLEKELTFKRRFFNNRRILIEERNDLWRNLVFPFKDIITVVNKLKTECQVLVSSTRDSYSINNFLRNYNLDISADKIFGNESGQNKVDHMEIIKEKFELEYKDIYCVDDNINHLLPLQKLGIKCFLSKWGYFFPEPTPKGISELYLDELIEVYQ